MYDISNIRGHHGMSARPSRAADIPQELFEDIIRHAVSFLGPLESQWSRVPSGYESMRNIYALSLVSKYFAAICRPRVFRNLQFCNAKQVRGFLALVQASPVASLPHVSTLVHEMYIKATGSDEYWIHQIATALLPRLRRHCSRTPRLKLSLKGHGSLATPRTMMPFVARSVQALYLQDMSFRRGEDLLRILAAFPILQYCILTSVTIATFPDPTAIRRHLPGNSLVDITFHDCTPAIGPWLVSWVMDGPAKGVGPLTRRWDTRDVEAIFELSGGIGVSYVRRYIESNDMALELKARDITVELHTETAIHLSGGSLLHARRVCRASFHVNASDEESWARVAATSAKLGRALEHLQEIEFQFTRLSKLEGFVTAFHTALWQAVDPTRLLYRRRSHCFDPQSILSKRTLRDCARFLGTESGWCRSIGRGGGSLVCIPAITA